MKKVYLSLGTNLGDKEQNILTAYDTIERIIGKIVNKSSNYRTPPWGFDSNEDFFNSIALVETELSATELLKKLKIIENQMGRVIDSTLSGYQDRIIDLDIIDYNGEVIHLNDLQIPHPRMHERNFVLFPLAEISPEWIHPKLQKTVSELKKNMPNLRSVP